MIAIEALDGHLNAGGMPHRERHLVKLLEVVSFFIHAPLLSAHSLTVEEQNVVTVSCMRS